MDSFLEWLKDVRTIVLGIGLVTAVVTWVVWHKGTHRLLDNSVAGLDKGMGDLNRKIDMILFHMAGVGSIKSPLRLTDLGAKVSEAIGAKGIAAELAPAMLAAVAGFTEYKIQEHCHTYFAGGGALTPDQVKACEDCAFKQGLGMEHMHLVCAIELHDELLRLQRGTGDQPTLPIGVGA